MKISTPRDSAARDRAGLFSLHPALPIHYFIAVISIISINIDVAFGFF